MGGCQVSWIDPRFKDLRVLGPDSNDDHPPSDVLAGQDLILMIYHALSSNPQTWPKTVLIIAYDEHGGFYDHVPPPAATDADPEFRRLGVRVPALLISPLVTPGSTSTTLLGADSHFDHTSIMKTIFTRFCQIDGQIPEMTARAGAANHLGYLLRDDGPRADVPDHSAATRSLTAWRTAFTEARFANPTAAAMAPHELTDFQNGFYEMARLLRHAGLPEGIREPAAGSACARSVSDGGYKYLRVVHIIDAMPLTAVGKLDRKALRQMIRRRPDDALCYRRGHGQSPDTRTRSTGSRGHGDRARLQQLRPATTSKARGPSS